MLYSSSERGSLRMCAERGRAGNSRACGGGGNAAVRSNHAAAQSKARSAWRAEVRAAGRMRGRTRAGAGGKCGALAEWWPRSAVTNHADSLRAGVRADHAGSQNATQSPRLG